MPHSHSLPKFLPLRDRRLPSALWATKDLPRAEPKAPSGSLWAGGQRGYLINPIAILGHRELHVVSKGKGHPVAESRLFGSTVEPAGRRPGEHKAGRGRPEHGFARLRDPRRGLT